MVCSACQSECREGAKFCRGCGAPLALRCPTCGAAREPEQRFCEECGAGLESAAWANAAGLTAGHDADLSGSWLAPAGPAGEPRVPDGAAARVELRQVSVLFVDLVGFTSLSEAREADEVRELLERYFVVARTIIERHRGVVQKFIGDAVMAVWGISAAREGDAERAVRAALAVVEAVPGFGAEAGAAGLRARGGVVTGQVAALESPGEGLMVGDRVNTASRAQSAADPGAVWVDEVTRQLSAAAIAYEDAGEHEVKGKAKPLRLWRAVRVIGGIGGSDREQGLQAPFVGRDGDLWLLKELLHGTLERRSARLVAVSGEAGMGKSRLRRELFNYVDGLSDTVLWHMGRCLPFGEGVTHWALAEMVRQRLGIAEEASVQATGARLAEGLERWVDDPADRRFLAPRLGALLGLGEPGLDREDLFAGWRLFLERLAQHLPVVLVFEDLQWADAELLEFIDQLLEWSASCPIFVLTLARPDPAADRRSWPTGRRGAVAMALEPLDERAMHELLAGLADELPDEASARIMERAQGVPLYAIELVRALADRGGLGEREGRLVYRRGPDKLDVPASLSSLLAARLDRLEPAERRFVKAMSVFGGAFARSTAVALGGLPEDELDTVLASLVHKQVLAIRAERLSPNRGQYAFAQGLLGTVAYEMLSRRERVLRHRAAADHLRQAFANDGEEVAEVIASQYLDAYRAAHQDPDAEELRRQARAALSRAARRAATVGAPEAAERSYRAAAELADGEAQRTELIQAAGEMAVQSGRYDAALELLEAAADAHRAAGRERDAALVAGDLGIALGRLGRPREAVQRLVAALEILGGDRLDADVARLNARLSRSLIFLGEYEQAGPPIEAALTIAEGLDLPAVLSDALSQEAIVHMSVGRVRQARYRLGAAIEIAEGHQLGHELLVARTNRANLAMLWDEPDAEEQIKAGLALARRSGDRAYESLNACNLMMVWVRSGRWPRAEELGRKLLTDDQDRPHAEWLNFHLSILQVRRGAPAAARARLQRMVRWEHVEDEEHRATHAAVVVSVLVAEGAFDRALAHGNGMLSHAIDALGTGSEAVRQAWPDTLSAALALGRHDDARQLLGLLAERPPGEIPPYLRAQLARGRALTDARQDRDDAVEPNLTAALGGFGRLGYPYWIAVTQTDLAGWLIGQGRSTEAARLVDQASETLGSLGAATALARVREVGGAQPKAGVA